MSGNSDFVKSLLQIPYFSALADEHGTDWLAGLFTSLDVENYDLAQLAAAKATASAIGSDASNLLVTVDNVESLGSNIAMDGPKPAAFSRLMAGAENFAGSAALAKAQGEKAAAAGPVDESAVFDNVGNSEPPPVLNLPDPTQGESGRYFSMLIRSYLDYAQATMAWAKGRDNLVFETGNQNILLNGDNEVTDLGIGNDNVYLRDGGNGGTGITHIKGGEGVDSLYLYRDEKHFGYDREISSDGFTVTLGGLNDFGKHGGRVELNQIENVHGSNGGDIISGDGQDNMLDGRSGNDMLSGGGGNDMLKGRDGDDLIEGDGGNDIILGGNGKNTLNGGLGDDGITGGSGIDTMDGGDGKDTLHGDDGADTIIGGAGDDTIDGGKGADKMTGGAGADTYVYLHVSDSPDGAAERDLIIGFDAAVDQFDFSDVGLSADVAPDKFTYIGTGAFTQKAGELRYEKFDLAGTDNDKTVIFIDNNGDKIADMEIELQGLITLASKNFDF